MQFVSIPKLPRCHSFAKAIWGRCLLEQWIYETGRLGLRRLGRSSGGSALRLGVHDHFKESCGWCVALDAIMSLKITASKRIWLVDYCEALAIFHGWPRLSKHIGLIYARYTLILVTLALDQLFQSGCLISIRQNSESRWATANE